MKKKKAVKTPRVASTVAPVETRSHELVESHEWIKIGTTVFFNISLVNEKFNMGTVKEIRVKECGRVTVTIWDEDKGMWRHILYENVLPQRPKARRGSR